MFVGAAYHVECAGVGARYIETAYIFKTKVHIFMCVCIYICICIHITLRIVMLVWCTTQNMQG